MRSDIHRDYGVTLDVEHRPEITLNYGGVDGTTIARGEPMNFVRTQTRIERVRAKSDECGARVSLLLDG